MVAESPANLECKVVDIINIGSEARTRVVVGEVLAIHVREDVHDGTRIDHDALQAVGRMAGDGYVNTRGRFDLGRPD